MLNILRVVGSRSLPCGCFVGVYETYTGATVEIVEERGPGCSDRSHHEGRVTSQAQPEGKRPQKHVAA